MRRSLEAKARINVQVTSESDCLTSGNAAFPLPSLAEQRRIVAEVERRLSVIRQAEDSRPGKS